ncbi:hypothetical protein [Streptomyces sp. JB150]|uniref:hypothetical protein n=1 Tax=Streptomyces sp. JB150 TaxID=2714844 RepID=UPI00140E3F14|nr:hypothetical protein [Streptomyces sp. JB150]QIJ62593.1 hypothetical protein G7Z13_11500 [Streptomyces sp. JB150]
MSTHTIDTHSRDQLRTVLRGIAGRDVAAVRVTRVSWPDGPRWVVMLLVDDSRAARGRREVPVVEGRHHRDVALLLRDAFPLANWAIAQDYDISTGALTEHRVPVPACLRGDDL